MEEYYPSDEHPLSVTAVNKYIKYNLESMFQNLLVEGEISNLKIQSGSGHCYFNLKDNQSQISCILWNSRYIKLGFGIEDGKKVIIKGKISVYEPRGTYSIEVFDIREKGLGDLYIAFEKLKNKLKEEGLFDSDRKKTIPEFPEKTAIITSESGAVIEDIKNVASKRFPLTKLFLFPSLVQGKEASESICKAIKAVNDYDIKFDVLIIARGGGSIEDLWAFNEESVARAVFSSRIPVVSAIGHETDFTICDMVSDLRAPTPSAAAEIIFPDISVISDELDDINNILTNVIRDKLYSIKKNIESIGSSYHLNRSKDIINRFKINLDDIHTKIDNSVSEFIRTMQSDLVYKEKFLTSISPESTLKRGFAYVTKDEKIVSNGRNLNKKDKVCITFRDGKKEAEIQ